MKRTTKQQVLATVEALGAEIEYGVKMRHFEILIDAPDGQHWKSDGLHQLVHSAWDDEPASALWKDALNRVSCGLEPCDPTNSNCQDSLDALEPNNEA